MPVPKSMWVSFIESIAIVVKYPGSAIYSNAFPAEFTFTNLFAPPVKLAGVSVSPVSYTHLTLPTSDLV